MFIDDEKSAARIRNQRTLFSAWIAAAAFAVLVTMAAGLFTSAHAASGAPQSSLAEPNHGLMTGLIIGAFAAMVTGAISLTRRPLRDLARSAARDSRRK